MLTGLAYCLPAARGSTRDKQGSKASQANYAECANHVEDRAVSLTIAMDRVIGKKLHSQSAESQEMSKNCKPTDNDWSDHGDGTAGGYRLRMLS